MSPLLRVLCASAAGCGVLAASAAGADVSLEVRAVAGMQAPGAPPGHLVRYFNNPVVNDAGEVAFVGYVHDTVQDLWSTGIYGPDAAGQVTSVVSGFDPVLDLPPDTLFSFNQTYSVSLDDAGAVAFGAGLSGPGIDYPENASGIWRWKAESGLARIARAGDSVPEAGPGAVLGPLYASYASPTLGSDGSVSFYAEVHDGSEVYSRDAVFTRSAQETTLFLIDGAPVPGVPGATFGFSGEAFANDHGVWSFTAGFEGPGVVAGQDDTGTFQWNPQSGPSLRIRAGDPAPGTPPGVVFASWNRPYPNAAGHFAYLAYLAGPGVSENDDVALYGPSASGALVLLAREGHAAPGTEAGTVFGPLFHNSHGVVINAGGEMVFGALLAGPSVIEANGFAIWRHRPGTATVERLVRVGDPAPELPGLVLAGLSNPILNDRGDLVYFATLAGKGVTPETDRAIFALEAGAAVAKKVFREGDVVPLGPGDLRPLVGFSVISGVPSDVPGAAQLSDAGHLAFWAHAADGTNAVVVATIPEPGFASGLAAGLVLLSGLARKQSRR